MVGAVLQMSRALKNKDESLPKLPTTEEMVNVRQVLQDAQSSLQELESIFARM